MASRADAGLGREPGRGRPPRTKRHRLAGHENIATIVDLLGKRVPTVDAALADAVGASIFDTKIPSSVRIVS